MREITAEFRLLTSTEGGRQTAIVSGYRPSLYLGELQTDGAIRLLDRDEQAPGETANVLITLLHPERWGQLLKANAEFEAKEGLKTVGYGKVIGICDSAE
jgi:translation elongation factor EF-Tu-like GTPase